MTRRIAWLLTVFALLVPFPAAESSAITAQPAPTPTTTTTGKVNDRTMEQYGGYTFKGKTKPSKKGQVVVFHFRRKSASKWRLFKVGPADGSNAFFVLDHNKPKDKINGNHRWKILFTPGVKPGRWVLRARFIRQDGYAASSVHQHVRVHASD